MITKEEHKKLMREWYQRNKQKVKRDLEVWRFGVPREVILERDNWECVKCGMNQEQHIVLFGRGLTIDHIDGQGRNTDKPNNDLDNLQTLCLRCHNSKDNKCYNQSRDNNGRFKK